MQLSHVGPGILDPWTTFLLREGYTLDAAGSRVGRLPAMDIAPVGAGAAGRLWQAVVAAGRRGGERLVERRRQQAVLYIQRVRAQCGYRADSSLGDPADIGRF